MAKLTKKPVIKQNTIAQRIAKLKALIKPPLTIHKLSTNVDVIRLAAFPVKFGNF
jgi:hypothetical protein